MDQALPEFRRVMANEREAKKVRESMRLRDVPPERSVQQAFELMKFTRLVSEAADNDQRKDS